MNATVFAALVRHVLTAVAGGFAVQYNIDGQSLDAIVAGVAAVAGVAWSLFEKRAAK